jgi:hypothetical protein
MPFQLHRRIPLLRRPFFQRDQARAERDQMAARLAHAELQRDEVLSEVANRFGEGFLWLLNRRPVANNFPLSRSRVPGDIDDGELVARTVAAYRRANSEYRKTASGWDQTIWDLKRDIHEALLHGTGEQAAALLRDPASTTHFWGFDAIAKAPVGHVEPHELVLKNVDAKSEWTTLYAVWVMDALRSLAEAVGAVRMDYPEVDRKSETVAEFLMATDPILDAIDIALGLHIDFPNPFPDELGLSSKRGIISFRAVQGVYQAWRIAGLARGNHDFRVVEIGAGLGRTAYYSAKMGFRNYTLIDIPLTNAAQCYFLGRTLDPDAVCMFGEDRPGIRVLPPSAFLKADDRYDLVINVDSLTEMSPEISRAYCEAIKARAGQFISINHEINPVTVREICAEIGMPAATRAPYWMRRGYVEEVFQIRN